MKPLRILQIINNLDIGGAEQLLVSTLSRFNQAKYHISVCCLEKTGPLEFDLRKQGFQVIRLNVRSPFVLLGLIRLFRYVRREKIDLVHTHLFKSDFIGGLTARLAGAPRWISTKHDEGTWMNPLVQFLDRKLSAQIDAIIVDSNAVKKAAERRGLPAKKMTVIHPSTIDLAKLSAQKINLEAIKQELSLHRFQNFVGIIGRLHPVKGHEFFLAAAQKVHRELSDTLFLIVGHGPLRSYLERQVEKLGLREYVLFIDYRENLFEILTVLDVVVLTSLSEGFPMVVLEAMAISKPIIATRVGGISEVLVDGEMGLLVSPRDVEALAEGILKLLKNPQAAYAMGRHGKERLAAGFTVQHMVQGIETVYDAIANDQSRFIQ